MTVFHFATNDEFSLPGGTPWKVCATPKGYGFWAFLVWKRVLHFAHFGLESDIVFMSFRGN